jgi:2'-hydroxyisoflavone reductase
VRILIVGGTRFVGRHVVARALAHGHQVTVLHRGTGCEAAAGAVHLHADRDSDLSCLAGQHWDATVDVCAYWPRQVTRLADALDERGGRHLLVSTVSVYAEPHEPELDESAPVLPAQGLDGEAPPLTAESYGPLKVGCEHVAQQRYAGRLLVVRPTIIVGPHDITGRFPSWVARMARGGPVLVPGAPTGPAQYVDARDLASFLVTLLEDGEEGVFNVVAPQPPYSRAEYFEAVRAAVAPAGTEVRWVASSWLADQGVRPEQLPLWSGSDEPDWVFALDPARALAAGLRCRPLVESAQDTRQWIDEVGTHEATRGLGLTAQREADLLSAWASR